MSIPLVQNNDKDSINTSLNAIKRNLDRINSMLGLVDNQLEDLSSFATKQELQDAVTALQPVDTVASGNLHSVTSNAVANMSSLNMQWFWNDDPNVNMDVLEKAETMPVGKVSNFRVGGIYVKNSPYGTGNMNCDFIYTCYRIGDSNFTRLLGIDVRANHIYEKAKIGNIWGDWIPIQQSVRASVANVVTSGAITFDWCSIEYRNGIYNIFGRVYQSQAVTISDGTVIGTIRQDLNANPPSGFPVNVHNFQNGQDYVLWFEVDGTIKIYGIGTQTLTFDFYINATYVR